MSSCICCNGVYDKEADDEVFECGICKASSHVKCSDLTKSIINAAKNEKSVKLCCKVCIDSPDQAIGNKVIEMAHLLYKIDAWCQERTSDSQLLTSLAKSVNDLNEKLVETNVKFDAMEANSVVPLQKGEPKNTKSYSSVVKNTVKPAVVIKPKQKQHSKKTLGQLTSTVSKSDVNVCNTRNIRDGGIVLCCNNNAETMKVKQIVHEKLGDDYEVILPAVKNPRLRITNIDTDIPDDNIIEELKNNNEQIRDQEIKLVTIIPKNFRGTM